MSKPITWKLIEVKASELKINPLNPKKRDETGFLRLQKSLSKFGKVFDGIANKDLSLIDGHSRLELTEPEETVSVFVPSRQLSQKEYLEMNAVFDMAKAGETDMQILEEQFTDQFFSEWGIENPRKTEAVEDDYEIPETIETDIVLGDLFEIGPHRLLCGDSTDSDQVARLMDGQKADITVHSPPYNVGRTPNGDEQKYLNDGDSKNNGQYLKLLNETTKNAVLNSVFSFVNVQSVAGNKLTLIEYLAELKEWFCDYIIWDKMQAEPAMGENVLNSRFEFVYVFGESAKRRIGVKKFRGSLENMIFIKSRQDKEFSNVHKATYPIAFAAYFIENFSVQSCLDLFCGTGTTMIAAHQLNRKCYGMELDPKYCQVIVDRMLKLDPTIEVKKNGTIYKPTM